MPYSCVFWQKQCSSGPVSKHHRQTARPVDFPAAYCTVRIASPAEAERGTAEHAEAPRGRGCPRGEGHCGRSPGGQADAAAAGGNAAPGATASLPRTARGSSTFPAGAKCVLVSIFFFYI